MALVSSLSISRSGLNASVEIDHPVTKRRADSATVHHFWHHRPPCLRRIHRLPPQYGVPLPDRLLFRNRESRLVDPRPGSDRHKHRPALMRLLQSAFSKRLAALRNVEGESSTTRALFRLRGSLQRVDRCIGERILDPEDLELDVPMRIGAGSETPETLLSVLRTLLGRTRWCIASLSRSFGQLSVPRTRVGWTASRRSSNSPLSLTKHSASTSPPR
jgi:hypothetical protein